MQLTPRQADVIVAIRNYRHVHGHAPTFRELADALDISRATTVQHVQALVGKRLLRHHPHRARTLEVVSDLGDVRKLLTTSDDQPMLFPPGQVQPPDS